MPPFPLVSGVGLKDFSALRNCRRGEGENFQAKNLIYGFNGSGKTTLSRIFASLQSGKPVAELPAGASFEVLLSDGTVVSSTAIPETLRSRILVFNTDFIEANLSWAAGRAAPVFYIGKEQASVAAELEAATAAVSETHQQLTAAEASLTSNSRAFDDYKRTAARAIEVELHINRGYRAPTLEADYASRTPSEEHRLSESEIEACKATLQRSAPLPKLTPIGVFPDFAERLKKVRDIAGSTVGTLIATDLRGHEEMLPWLKAGLDYHRSHTLTSCLFCMGALGQDRFDTIAAAVDGKFKELVSDIDQLRENLETWQREVTGLENSIPGDRDIGDGQRPTFALAAEALRQKLQRMRGTGDHCIQLLKSKATNPTQNLSSTLASDAEYDEWGRSVTDAIREVNTVINTHNEAHDSFENVRRDTALKLKQHLLLEGYEEFKRLSQGALDARQAVDDLKTRQRTNSEEVERLQGDLRQHGPAADTINALIKGYLGHDDLQIVPLNDGYEIRRRGENQIGRLSEGEKTAIALCYFISTIQAEDRTLEDLIVVVDDPISSLDTRALHYAFNLLRASLSRAGQLFILTHNMYLMQEVKKWLKSAAYPREGTTPTARLLYLDSAQKPGELSKSSGLCELPKLLRDYESEYQYLCHLVFRFVEVDDPDNEHLFLIPNAIRKVLEIFLAFKDPGTAPIGDKIDQLLRKDYGLDPARLRALERLSQLESHSDNLDDLIGFSSMTVEESRAAAFALMDAMGKVDPGHYQRLQRICRRR